MQTQKIYIFNGTDKNLDSMLVSTLSGINNIVPLDPILVNNPRRYLLKHIAKSLDPETKEVIAPDFLARFHNAYFRRDKSGSGKVIFLEGDAVCGGGVLGVANEIKYGGYVVISKKTLADEVLAKDVLRHEMGHMFGLKHCTKDPFCVMKESRSLCESIFFVYKRLDENSPIYCPSCEDAIKDSIGANREILEVA